MCVAESHVISQRGGCRGTPPAATPRPARPASPRLALPPLRPTEGCQLVGRRAGWQGSQAELGSEGRPCYLKAPTCDLHGITSLAIAPSSSASACLSTCMLLSSGRAFMVTLLQGAAVAWPWRGQAWLGQAWRGQAWPGGAWPGVARRGVARRGVARRGQAWRGLAWRALNVSRCGAARGACAYL